MVKAKKLRKPSKKQITKDIGCDAGYSGLIYLECPHPLSLWILDTRAARKMAAWLNRAADWAEQQQKQEKTK